MKPGRLSGGFWLGEALEVLKAYQLSSTNALLRHLKKQKNAVCEAMQDWVGS